MSRPGLTDMHILLQKLDVFQMVYFFFFHFSDFTGKFSQMYHVIKPLGVQALLTLVATFHSY